MNTDKTEKKTTDMKLVTARASLIFAVILVVLVGSSSASLLAGWKSGDIQKKFAEIQKTTDEIMKVASSEANTQNSYVHTSSVSSSESQMNVSTGNQTQIQINGAQNIQYTYPTHIPYPTIVPGQPGSKEWEEQFQKDFNDTKAKIDAKQKEMEANQQKFCQENPSLCH